MRFLKQWAPGLPKIIRNTMTEHVWTIGQLEAAIRAENCVSCGELSDHIFIPTMERICMGCMRFNQAYWCCNLDDAMKIFGLNTCDVENINKIHDPRLPLNDESDSAWLVPVKSALAIALGVWLS